MEKQHYPRLYIASSSFAINAQKSYFRLLRAKILLLLLNASVVTFAWSQLPSLRTWEAFGVAIVLIAWMAISAFMDSKKFDRVWFNGRAVAESTKKECWNFMMRAEPYNSHASQKVAEERFLNRLKEILNHQPSIPPRATPLTKCDTEITEHMRQIRQKNLRDRLDYYVLNRIRDQKDWYTDKANQNRKSESRWYASTWILQVAAVIAAISIISIENSMINPVGVFTTATAGVLAWMNARRYRELSQSYGFTAQELSILETKAAQVSREGELEELVTDVEGTISREHTIWVARRLI